MQTYISEVRSRQPGSGGTPLPGYRPTTSWMNYTTSCYTQSSAPEDGRDQRPKHVELIGIINKPLLLHLFSAYIIYELPLSLKFQQFSILWPLQTLNPLHIFARFPEWDSHDKCAKVFSIITIQNTMTTILVQMWEHLRCLIHCRQSTFDFLLQSSI